MDLFDKVSEDIKNAMKAKDVYKRQPLVSKGGTSTLINCAYIGMILSVSRYTAHLEEQKAVSYTHLDVYKRQLNK